MKKCNTIGCCGIDCGLCPRYYTQGSSACPGCGSPDFKEKHPSCGFLTCCVNKRQLEVCSDCKDYPCTRFEPEKKGFDSFVTHKKIFTNLNFIRENGIAALIAEQKERIDILINFLQNFDDGRSKSFYCLSCALLPLDKLKIATQSIAGLEKLSDKKEINKQLKESLQLSSNELGIELKLNNKK